MLIKRRRGFQLRSVGAAGEFFALVMLIKRRRGFQLRSRPAVLTFDLQVDMAPQCEPSESSQKVMTFTPTGFTHSFGRGFYIQDALELLPPLRRFLLQGRGAEYGQHNSSDHHHHRNMLVGGGGWYGRGRWF
jgi:hypothetical protein